MSWLPLPRSSFLCGCLCEVLGGFEDAVLGRRGVALAQGLGRNLMTGF